jgi:lipopolysaccharide transport system ATP-binding protein
MASVDAEHVSVDFPLYHGSARSLKRAMFAAASGGRIGKDARKRVVVQGLRDVSFHLGAGDRLGLVGSNGAGKTTLLRTLAGIYEPVRGRIRVQGSLNALLDPNLGMNPDLTGRENISLRGLFAGLGRAAIRRLEDDVRDFADLDEFMDLPVRTYSSGMVVRLGFALATAIHPEVLLMDEWFLAGDAGFMEKARTRLETLVRSAEILVLSSHIKDVVTRWCTRVIWLDKGRIMEDGAPDEVLGHYLAASEAHGDEKADAKPEHAALAGKALAQPAPRDEAALTSVDRGDRR